MLRTVLLMFKRTYNHTNRKCSCGCKRRTENRATSAGAINSRQVGLNALCKYLNTAESVHHCEWNINLFCYIRLHRAAPTGSVCGSKWKQLKGVELCLQPADELSSQGKGRQTFNYNSGQRKLSCVWTPGESLLRFRNSMMSYLYYLVTSNKKTQFFEDLPIVSG